MFTPTQQLVLRRSLTVIPRNKHVKKFIEEHTEAALAMIWNTDGGKATVEDLMEEIVDTDIVNAKMRMILLEDLGKKEFDRLYMETKQRKFAALQEYIRREEK